MPDYAPTEVIQTTISISLPKRLLEAIDKRAEQLHLPRSRYLAVLAQTDIKRGGTLTLTPMSGQTKLEDFLDHAIPLLEDYLRDPNGPLTVAEFLEAIQPETPEDQKTWDTFFAERKKILDLKWIESQKAERDIGWTAAVILWVRDHRSEWLVEYQRKYPSNG